MVKLALYTLTTPPPLPPPPLQTPRTTLFPTNLGLQNLLKLAFQANASRESELAQEEKSQPEPENVGQGKQQEKMSPKYRGPKIK